MRLLYLSCDPGIAVLGEKGASVHIRALASALHELGHDVIVASPRIERGAEELPAEVRLAQIPAVRPRDCATREVLADRIAVQARAVADLAAREEVEAIHERYSLAGCAGARTAAALGLPLVLEVNAPLREEERRFRELVYEDVALRAEQEAFAAATTIFTVSRGLADWVVGLGIAPARVEVMANAPPAHVFPAKPALRDGETVVVGFAGGLRPWHGIDVLVSGFGDAIARGANLRLEVLGRGPADDVLDRAALPEDRVLRHGHLPHEVALGVLSRWDVGLAPYPPLEDFYFSPLKLLEYMAAGICPVVSGIGDLPRIVEHGRAGVVVQPGDPRALSDALVALDLDRRRLRRLGDRARTVARSLPSWSDNARRVIEATERTRPVPVFAVQESAIDA